MWLKVSRAQPALGTANHGDLQIMRPLGQSGAIELGEPIELNVVQSSNFAAVWKTAPGHPSGLYGSRELGFRVSSPLVQHRVLWILIEILYIAG